MASNKGEVEWGQPVITWCIHFYHVACLPLGPEALYQRPGQLTYPLPTFASLTLPIPPMSKTSMSDQFPFWLPQSLLKCVKIFHWDRLKSRLCILQDVAVYWVYPLPLVSWQRAISLHSLILGVTPLLASSHITTTL